MDLDEGYNISETGNWNVAADYSKLKIMKPLYLIDEYANIAIFGSSTLVEELQNQFPVDQLRMTGFKRLIHTLITLIDNSQFAIKKKTDKDDLGEHRKNLKRIEKIMYSLFKEVVNHRTKQSYLKIDPEKFEKILEFVLSIKSKINEPLNRNHLIFTDKEEFDPKKYKEKVFEDAVNRG